MTQQVIAEKITHKEVTPQKKPKTFPMWVFILGSLATIGISIAVGMFIGNNYMWIDPVIAKAKSEIPIYQGKVDANPKDLESRVALGYRYYLVKDYANAITTLKGVIDMDKDYYDAYLNLGHTYFSMEEYDDALENFDMCTKIGPSDHKGWLNLGITYYKLGDYQQSFKALDNARYINRGSADILYHYGVALELSGDIDEAIIAYEEALQYNANYTEAKEALKKLVRE